MKNRKAKLSKRTLGLLAAVVLLVVLTGGMAAQAALSVFSEDYNAEFRLDHINVALLENGVIVGDVDAETNEVRGKLLTALNRSVEPGKIYEEEIAARNMSDIPEYVRISIRTFWCDVELDENNNEVWVKDTSLDPGLIELTFNGDTYNTGAWQLNEQETTTERKVYYLSEMLPGGEDSAPVVNQFCVNGTIIDDAKAIPTEETIDGKTHTVYTYVFEYDGKHACVEADVQSIQTHNAQDAVDSLWGVENVTAADGKLTVN